LRARVNRADLNIIGEFIDAAKVTPVIDTLYRFNEVLKTVRYLAERHARGKVTITTF